MISQRVLATFSIVLAIMLVCAFRIVYVYPGQSIPLTELVGALGALAVSVPFVWMKRFTTLQGTAVLAVPCVSWGVIALVLWGTGERTLAVLTSGLFIWYAVDWIKNARNPKKHEGGGK